MVVEDLVHWLGAELDKDARAQQGYETAWHRRDCESIPDPNAWGGDTFACSCGVPARVLREIRARRLTLDQHAGALARMGRAMQDGDTEAYQRASTMEVAFRAALRNDATVYSDRPGYQESWRP